MANLNEAKKIEKIDHNGNMMNQLEYYFLVLIYMNKSEDGFALKLLQLIGNEIVWQFGGTHI